MPSAVGPTLIRILPPQLQHSAVISTDVKSNFYIFYSYHVFLFLHF